MAEEHTSNIPIEKKLELIRLMRSESHQNRQKMRGRERIIYEDGGLGKSFCSEYRDEKRSLFDEHDRLMRSDKAAEGRGGSFVSLRLRFFAAILLFAAFLAWDNGYYPALPQNNGQLYSMIEEDMLSANIFAFIEDFTYTLKD